MGRKATLVNLFDIVEKKYVGKSVTFQEIADFYGTSKNSVEAAFYQDKIYRKKYKLEISSEQTRELKECEKIERKISDDKEYYIKFTYEWDMARFSVNPNAKRY